MSILNLAVQPQEGERFFTQDAYGTLKLWKQCPQFNRGHGWFMSSTPGRVIERHPSLKSFRDDSRVYLANLDSPQENLFKSWMATDTVSVVCWTTAAFRRKLATLNTVEKNLVLDRFLQDYAKGSYLDPLVLPCDYQTSIQVYRGLIPALDDVAGDLVFTRSSLIEAVLSAYLLENTYYSFKDI